jgi:hypothetical protein
MKGLATFDAFVGFMFLYLFFQESPDAEPILLILAIGLIISAILLFLADRDAAKEENQ